METSQKPFESFKINSLQLKNRFVLAAAKLDEDFNAKIRRYTTLAENDVGLIMTGGMRVHQVEEWKPIIDAIHKKNGKIALQFVSERGPGAAPWATSDKEPLAVSVLPPDNPYFHAFIKYAKHREISEKEILNLIQTYAKAVKKAKEIGAAAVEIHAAHDNFLSQFLSPITNHRTDQWGGSLENRIRLHREIIKAIRAEVGKTFPVIIKLGVEDGFPEGLKFEEGKKAAQLIAECDYDALEISQGLMNFSVPHANGTPMRNASTEAYFRNWCREIKQTVKKPTIMTGGMRSYELISEVLDNHETDLIGICRPLIRESNLISRWKKGDFKKATCVSCNKCFMESPPKDGSLKCVIK